MTEAYFFCLNLNKSVFITTTAYFIKSINQLFYPTMVQGVSYSSNQLGKVNFFIHLLGWVNEASFITRILIFIFPFQPLTVNKNPTDRIFWTPTSKPNAFRHTVSVLRNITWIRYYASSQSHSPSKRTKISSIWRYISYKRPVFYHYHRAYLIVN